MKQKGLGRGLDALFGLDRIEQPARPVATPMSDTAELRIDRIIPNPQQPRSSFDEEALEELADSIRTLGVIQPITVAAANADGKYLIISGERRWRASRKAGLKTLPVYIREVDDENLYAMALVENIQRQDLNAIEIAIGMQRLVDECHLTQDALSEKVGKKRSTVANYMRLLKLPDPVQLALKEGLISMGHAKAIAGVEEDKQLQLLARCLKRDLSVRQAEEYARKMAEQPAARPDKASVAEEEYPESYGRLVEQLERLFSQRISVRRAKNGGGRITIDFSDDADVDRFVDRLKEIPNA